MEKQFKWGDEYGRRVRNVDTCHGIQLCVVTPGKGPAPKKYPRPMHFQGCTCAFCYSFPKHNQVGDLMPGKQLNQYVRKGASRV